MRFYSTVTDFARFLNMWFRPAAEAAFNTQIARVSLHCKTGRDNPSGPRARYSTVTDFARFLGLSTSVPLASAA